MAIFEQFVSKDATIGLQCLAEIQSGNIVDSLIKDFFSRVTLHGSQSNQYILLGLQRAINSKSYQLTSLELSFNGDDIVDMSRHMEDMKALVRSAKLTWVCVEGQLTEELWNTVLQYHEYVDYLHFNGYAFSIKIITNILYAVNI